MVTRMVLSLEVRERGTMNMVVPDAERMRFESLIMGWADRYGLSGEEYLRKVWYHEEASRLGEYVALTLLDQLLSLMPVVSKGNEEA